jgi:hypothetical protein
LARDVVSGLRASDPIAFGVMPLVIAIVVIAALLVPVTRVVRRDPLAALRNE